MKRLECRVGLGTMAHERVLFVEGVDRTYETWADSRDVRVLRESQSLEKAQAIGEVDVVVVSTEPTRDVALVELPNEVTLGGRRVWVRTMQLR